METYTRMDGQYNDQFWEQADFMKAATLAQWNNPPYIPPVDVLN